MATSSQRGEGVDGFQAILFVAATNSDVWAKIVTYLQQLPHFFVFLRRQEVCVAKGSAEVNTGGWKRTNDKYGL